MSDVEQEIERLPLVIERMVRALRMIHGDGGLTPAAASALGYLVDVGAMGVSELARLSSVTQPAMSQLTARLVGEGLVERGADDSDRRSVILSATSDGREAYRRRRAVRAERIDRAVSQLPQSDRTTLAAAVPVLERLFDLSDND